MNHPSENTSRIKLTISMLIFGTIGIFRTFIPFPSGTVAFARGLIGTVFILILLALKREKLNKQAIKKNLPLLCISGAFIGFNWILLFEAYRYTSVSTATLCYYMAPVIVILFSPIILKEKLTAKKLACTVAAIFGMALISGIFSENLYGAKGILLGLGAAALYASVIMMNKFIHGLSDYEKTIFQLGTAAISILPYILIAEDIKVLSFSAVSLILLLVVGIIHTGVAYSLYFGSIEGIKAHTAAIFSYIDPVVALILSAVILHEDFGVMKLIGSVLVLGATLISELPSKKKEKNQDS